MNTKTTLVVAIVAGILFVALLTIRPWDEPEAVETPKTTAKALFDPKPEDVDRVEVTVKASRDPKRVLAKEDDKWQLVEPLECPAEESQVTSIISTVTEAQYLRSYEPGDDARPSDEVSGLSDPTAVVKLFSKDKPVADLVVGSRTPTGKGDYVKLGGSETVYELKESLRGTLTKRVKDLRGRQVINVDQKNVTAVEVSGRANFKLVKSGDNWMIEEPMRGRADKTKAGDVVRQVTSLYIQDWIEDEPASLQPYGLDEPQVTAKVTGSKTIPPKAKPGDPDTQPADIEPSEEPIAHTLLVGGLAGEKTPLSGEKTYFAKLDDAPWVFTIGSYNYEKLTTKLSDLREKTLADIDQAKVSKIVAQVSGGEMTLTKKEGKWTFADGQSGDTTAVSDLVKALADLKATDFVDPAEPVMPADWENPRARITLTLEGEPNPVTLVVGRASASGKMAYVRNMAEDAIAVVREDDVTPLLAGRVSYGDRQVMVFPAARVERLEVARGSGPAVVLKKEKNKWAFVEPIAAAADAPSVRDLVQDLSSLRAKSIVGEGDKARYGLDKPDVTVTVHAVPPAADPNVKVIGEDKADDVGEDEADDGGEDEADENENKTARPAKHPSMSDEGLLEFMSTMPADQRNPKVVQMLEDRIASRKAESATTEPAATGPAGTTQPAKAQKLTNQDLLDYLMTLPEKERNPLMVDLLKDLIAKEKGEKPADAQPAKAVADKPEAKPETRPAEEAKPTVYRISMSRRDEKVYACVDGRDLVYELDAKVYDDATAELHDRRVTQFSVDSAAELTLADGDTTLTFRKTGDMWKYAADPVLPIDDSKVKEVLNAFRELKTHRYVDYAASDLAQYGLAGKVKRVAAAVEGGERVEIRLADKGPADDADNSRYAVLGDSNKVFLLKGDQTEKFDKKLKDFEKAQ